MSVKVAAGERAFRANLSTFRQDRVSRTESLPFMKSASPAPGRILSDGPAGVNKKHDNGIDTPGGFI
jgi:hypothetical protein